LQSRRIGNSLERVIDQRSRGKTNKQMKTLTGTENFTASVAAGCKRGVIAVSTVNLIRFRSELFVDKRDATHLAQEASLMPVFVFVAQVLLNVNRDEIN
jgi:hypothetical protein